MLPARCEACPPPPPRWLTWPPELGRSFGAELARRELVPPPRWLAWPELFTPRWLVWPLFLVDDFGVSLGGVGTLRAINGGAFRGGAFIGVFFEGEPDGAGAGAPEGLGDAMLPKLEDADGDGDWAGAAFNGGGGGGGAGGSEAGASGSETSTGSVSAATSVMACGECVRARCQRPNFGETNILCAAVLGTSRRDKPLQEQGGRSEGFWWVSSGSD